jgi:hypothetical protein
LTAAVDAVGVWDDQGDPLACSTAELCVAVDETGNFIAGTPSVGGSPAITEDPTNLVTPAGDVASFTTVATGGPALTVEWQVTSNDGASYQDVAGATSPTLSFTATKLDSGDGYRAEFRGTTELALTSTAKLSILTAAAPTFVSAAAATLVAGEPGGVVIRAVGSPTPTLTEAGKRPRGVKFANIGDGYATIAGTPGVHTARKYHITITAVNSAGSSPQAFTLTVAEPPASPRDWHMAS